jgi:hypothetical protein
MGNRNPEARGFNATAPPNETPTPGAMHPASVSDAEGSGADSTAGFTALPEVSPLTGDAQTATPGQVQNIKKHPGLDQDVPLATARTYRQPDGAVVPHCPGTTLLPSEVSKAKAEPRGRSASSERPDTPLTMLEQLAAGHSQHFITSRQNSQKGSEKTGSPGRPATSEKEPHADAATKSGLAKGGLEDLLPSADQWRHHMLGLKTAAGEMLRGVESILGFPRQPVVQSISPMSDHGLPQLPPRNPPREIERKREGLAEGAPPSSDPTSPHPDALIGNPTW